jgi:hypothetical protein
VLAHTLCRNPTNKITSIATSHLKAAFFIQKNNDRSNKLYLKLLLLLKGFLGDIEKYIKKTGELHETKE